MDVGFLLDRFETGPLPGVWMEGAADVTWAGLDTYERQQFRLQGFRCPKCWYVEWYAPPA